MVFINDLIEVFVIVMKTIITLLIIDPEEYQQKTKHPHGQAGDVDNRIEFVPRNVSQSDF